MSERFSPFTGTQSGPVVSRSVQGSDSTVGDDQEKKATETLVEDWLADDQKELASRTPHHLQEWLSGVPPVRTGMHMSVHVGTGEGIRSRATGTSIDINTSERFGAAGPARHMLHDRKRARLTSRGLDPGMTIAHSSSSSSSSSSSWNRLVGGNESIQTLHRFAELIAGHASVDVSQVWNNPTQELVDLFRPATFDKYYEHFFKSSSKAALVNILGKLRVAVQTVTAPNYQLETFREMLKKSDTNSALAQSVGRSMALTRSTNSRQAQYENTRKFDAGTRKMRAFVQELGAAYRRDFLNQNYTGW